MDANVCVGARGRGIAVIVELTCVCTHHAGTGSDGAVGADGTVVTRCSADPVEIRLPSGALDARADDVPSARHPVLTSDALCARGGRVLIGVDLARDAFVANCLSTSRVCSGRAVVTWRR